MQSAVGTLPSNFARMVDPPEGNLSSPSNVQTNGRRRSVSIAETQPSVETVMAKAKRAALSLWMLLHAQNCTLGRKCPHTGCQEAKLLHLHMKTCHTNADGECPLAYHGCDQSRKLLAHHRRCKSLRMNRQQAPRSSQSPGPQHYCLVCSLVARQARTLLTTTSSLRTSSTTHTNSSICKTATSTSPAKKLSSPRNNATTFAISTKLPPATDSLSHLYEMAKQLDEGNAAQRSRAVSDAELVDRTRRVRPRSASLGTSPQDCTTITEEVEGEGR